MSECSNHNEKHWMGLHNALAWCKLHQICVCVCVCVNSVLITRVKILKKSVAITVRVRRLSKLLARHRMRSSKAGTVIFVVVWVVSGVN